MKSGVVYQSAETIGSVDDILSQILVNLPFKPLIRFKLVSKQWLSLITSHGFCVMRNPIPEPAQGFLMGIIKKDGYMYDYVSVSLYPNSHDSFVPPVNLNFTTHSLLTKVSQSCNGLLLCYSRKGYPYPLYVYNPTTSVSTRIPTYLVHGCYPLGAALVFDPVKSPYFKVFFVMKNFIFSEQTWHILVYSSETGGWSSSDGEDMVNWSLGDCDKRMYCDRDRWVYWNGCVHFINNVFYREILIFHVDSLVLRRMPTPPLPLTGSLITGCSSNPYYFGVSCDHLHFIQLALPVFDVYEMKRDYSELFVKYRVDLSPFIAEYPEVIVNRSFAIYVLSLVRGESENDSKLVLRIPGKAVKINLVDGASEKLCDFLHDRIACGNNLRDNKCPFDDEYVLDYIPSLSSF